MKEHQVTIITYKNFNIDKDYGVKINFNQVLLFFLYAILPS